MGDANTYKGVPRKDRSLEKTQWQRFLEYLFPWLKDKWALGNQYITAKVRKEEAQAMEHAASAQRHLAEVEKLQVERLKLMQEVVHESEKLEKEKMLSYGDDMHFDNKDLEEAMLRLAEKLDRHRVIHGLSVSILDDHSSKK